MDNIEHGHFDFIFFFFHKNVYRAPIVYIVYVWMCVRVPFIYTKIKQRGYRVGYLKFMIIVTIVSEKYDNFAL